MINKKQILILGILLLMTLSLIQAADFGGGVPSSFTGDNYRVFGSSVNPQFTQPSFYGGLGINPRDYWMNFNQSDCRERQDVILTIPPGGCSPTVVRSDLLEERNVPVFCKVSSIQVNPLIDISKIRSIHFKNQEAKGAQVSYFPARTAVRSSRTLEGSPIIENVGYLVITLPRYKTEDEMPEWVGGNVTAVIDYDAEGVFGVGEHDFYLSVMEDDEWENSYKENGFWKGKGFIRLDSVDENSARISIYRDGIRREATVSLEKGKTSDDIYLDGYYCAAGMNIKVEDIDYPVDAALLIVDDEDVWVADGSRFLNGKCKVSSVEPGEVGGGSVKLSCSETGNINLILDGPPATLRVKSPLEGKEDIDEYMPGNLVTRKNNEEVYLAYSGRYPNSKADYAVLVSMPQGVNQFEGLGAFVNNAQRQWHSYKYKTEKIKWAVVTAAGYGILAALTGGGSIIVATVAGSAGIGAIGIFDNFINEEKLFYESYLPKQLVEKYNIDKGNIGILIGPGAKWEDYGITMQEPVSGEAVLDENQILKEYYDLAVKNYKDVFELYPYEKPGENMQDNLEPYAVEALYNAAELAGQLGLKSEQIKYLEKIIENYPDSSKRNQAEQDLASAYKGKISKDSQAIVYVNNEPHFISLRDFKKPKYEDLGAELIVTTDTGTKTIQLEKDTIEKVSGQTIKISEINEDSVDIEYIDTEKSIQEKGVDTVKEIFWDVNNLKKTTIKKGEWFFLSSKLSVKLVNTNLNRQAKIKIIPKTFGMRTESNLSFKVGIERRAIKLSPEKTQEMIDNIAENIKKWQDVNDKLGKVVTGLKGACFATSAMLVVKNLFSGWSGESMARHEVMTAQGGWNEKCRLAFANNNDICGKGNPVSEADCLLDCNPQIEDSVNKLAGYYNEENQKLKEIQERYKTGSDILDFTGGTDPAKVRKDYCEEVFKKTSLSGNIEIKGSSVPLVGDNGLYSQSQIDNCEIDLEEMKMLRLRELVKDDAMLSDIINKKLGADLIYTYEINKNNREKFGVRESFGLPNAPVKNSAEKTKYEEMSDVSGLSGYNFDSKTKKYFLAVIDGKEVLVGLAQTQGNKYYVNQVFDSSKFDITNQVIKKDRAGNDITYKQYFDVEEGVEEFTLANPGLYNNEMKGNPKVKYYERAPYTGLPAQVPFDKERGWYVGTDYVLSGFGKPYEESGRAINFWICNVGKNGLIEFKQGDECRYYNLGTSQNLDFPGLSASESARLVRDAETAIRQASQQHGKKEVLINGQVFGTDIAENGETGQCSDFMSPQDCHLMFNVCDPVICPESRCDYGGQYRVSNVVQSGIIGSLLLCLPNANEGIMIPICLTGVHAGIDGYLSILKSAQSCLQESLDTGRNIGICDEIKSIYLCEFFWRQTAPLMDVFIPRLFEAFFGQGVRGGGEYMTVNYAWENAKASVDYFKNEYAVNAMKAFNSRSTAEAGGEVCKSFIGARYPDSDDFLDNLLEPESPVQYHAWFSENILTEATIPATSHYKVYYHVYAGKDAGAHYVVYLKNPPQSSYVHTLGTYVVDRSYIERGSQVDEARDFTGVSGYQELCININGQEECGFKQVSTSWALDEIARQYAAEQATEGVTKTQECVAGETSLWSFAQPNLQAGAQEAISPELYKRGIIRVCSSDNPGSAEKSGELDRTNSTFDRWKKVGFCDTESIGCWIDTQSVKDVLADAPNLTAKVLNEIDLNYLGEPEIMAPDAVNNVFESADKFKLGLATNQLTRDNIDAKVNPIVKSLIKITESGGLNTDKARAFLLVGKIYDLVVREIYSKTIPKTTAGSGESEKINQDEEDNFAIGTRVKDLDGEIWVKIGDNLWRGESSLDEVSLSNIPKRPVTLIEETDTAKIIKVEHEIKESAGDDELLVDVTFENKGEENYFMLRIYNADNEKIDEKSHILVSKDNQKTIRLSTAWSLGYSLRNMGDYYTVELWKMISTGKYEKIDSERRDIK